MYSLGVVLWEIFARQPPMQDVPRRELMTRVCYEELRPDVSVLPLSCPAAYKKLCEACWLKPAMAEYRYVHITTIYLLYIACASSHVLSAAAAVLRYFRSFAYTRSPCVVLAFLSIIYCARSVQRRRTQFCGYKTRPRVTKHQQDVLRVRADIIGHARINM